MIVGGVSEVWEIQGLMLFFFFGVFVGFVGFFFFFWRGCSQCEGEMLLCSRRVEEEGSPLLSGVSSPPEDGFFHFFL